MPIRRALISVSDKTGILDFAKVLAAKKVELLSTGGTLKALESAGIPVVGVETYTGSPEVMDGRVKTLHPRVHGGLLGREGKDDADLARLGGAWIDLVIVNLYPFEQTLAKASSSFEELIENIDIGGPSMLRSAAKNHDRVTVICDPSDYSALLKEIETAGEVSSDTRRRLAAKVFAHTSAYDGMVSGWLSGVDQSDGYPRFLTLSFEKAYPLRYGENPHQPGAFYRERRAPAGSLALSKSLGSGAKELSFNNLVDVEAALDAVREFTEPAAVVVKHASPCGIASAASLALAYRLAREADATSAFGGIVALNQEVGEEAAALLAETFLECIVAPSFSEKALSILTAKKALRLLATGTWLSADHDALMMKRIGGGLVVQSRDKTAGGEVLHGTVATKKAPSPEQIAALEFAWRAAKHVRSNAIVLTQSVPDAAGSAFQTVGIGGGQTSRVDATEIACSKAGDKAKGAVLASDAFFPFPDGVERAARAGVSAIAQPGGSKKDPEVIEAADRLGLAMVFTGARHFRH